MEITLIIPTPPTLNMAYANYLGRGRIATKILKNWKKEAGWKLQLQHPYTNSGPSITDSQRLSLRRWRRA